MKPSPIRSIGAVLGGAVIVRWVGQALEAGLVLVASDVNTLDGYFEARNRFPILVGVVATSGIGAVLAGYVAAKIARAAELAHVAFAAAFQVVLSVLEYTTGGNPGMYPFWVQVAVPLVTVPAMLAGAMVRAKARILQEQS